MSIIEKVFHYEENEISVVKCRDGIWFRGKDIAKALGYEKTRNAILKHVIYLFIEIHKTFTKNVTHQYGCWVKCKFVKTIYIQKAKREKGIYNKWLKTLYSESTARNLSSFIHISILVVF